MRESARTKLDRTAEVEVAGAIAPDGALWFFVAAPAVGGKLGTYRLLLIRCADVGCSAPQRHQVAMIGRTPRDGYRNGGRARLSFDPAGRPVASFWVGWTVNRYRCEPVTCANPSASADLFAPPDAVWDSTPAGIAALKTGLLFRRDRSKLVVGDAAVGSDALAVAGPYAYVTAARPSGPDSGFHLTVGEPAQYWRQTVWRCVDLACVSAPLDIYRGQAGRGLLAVADDGRALVVREDRIVVLETPFPGTARVSAAS